MSISPFFLGGIMKFTWDDRIEKENSCTIEDNYKITVEPYRSQEYTIPNYQQGWICPKCGRVNAPWTGICPCFADKNPIRYNYKINLC